MNYIIFERWHWHWVSRISETSIGLLGWPSHCECPVGRSTGASANLGPSAANGMLIERICRKVRDQMNNMLNVRAIQWVGFTLPVRPYETPTEIVSITVFSYNSNI